MVDLEAWPIWNSFPRVLLSQHRISGCPGSRGRVIIRWVNLFHQSFFPTVSVSVTWILRLQFHQGSQFGDFPTSVQPPPSSLKIYLLFSYLAAPGLSCGTPQVLHCGVTLPVAGRLLSSCSGQAQSHPHPTSIWDLSSLTRNQSHVFCIGGWILNHWTSGQVPLFI